MSLSHSPKVITDSLVFYYDIGNTKKSWKGAPTTNLLVNDSDYSDSNWNRNADGLTISTTIVIAPSGKYSQKLTETATTAYHRRGQLISGSAGSARRFFIEAKAAERTYLRAWSWAGGDTSQQTFNLINGTCTGSLNPAMRPLGDNWWQCEFDVPAANNDTVIIGPSDGIVSGTATYVGDGVSGIYVGRSQLEVGTYSNPYVSGIRTNTQAIVDLTNRNTITTTSLTYNADKSFSFNANSNNYLTVPANSSVLNFNTAQTIVIWMKNQSPSSARRNPYNQAYGGGGTITHENDTNFNYYWGTAGNNNVPYSGFTSGFSVNIGETAMICLTRDASTVSWYKNGTFYNSTANPYGAGVVTGTSDITIGSGYAGAFGGNLYAVQLYTKALTAAEVSQNFDTLRRRYGL
jgi:hypothetical protein